MTARSGLRSCRVCVLPPDILVQVDAILTSDPSTWNETIYAGLVPADGLLSPHHRQWGAVRMTQEWLTQHELKVDRRHIETHYDRHLPSFPSPTQPIIDANGRLPDPLPLPVMEDYRTYYRDALRIGRSALSKLEARIVALEEAGDPVPVNLLMEVARLGARMAQSQATLIVGKGARFHAEEDEGEDTIEGFMGERPGPRFGSVRIREVEGEMRAITDEGPKDRAEYNERARHIGAPELPV